MNLRLYFDVDAADADLIAALRARGVDLETAHEAGMIEREDLDQLAYATAQGRVICRARRTPAAGLPSPGPGSSGLPSGNTAKHRRSHESSQSAVRAQRAPWSLPLHVTGSLIPVPTRRPHRSAPRGFAAELAERSLKRVPWS